MFGGKFKLLTIIIFLFSGLFGTAFSSWTYNANTNINNTAQIVILDWDFETPSITPGTIITVDEDGKVYIDGEEAQAEVNADGDTYNNGNVEIKIEVDDEGNFVLTEFTTHTTSLWALIGNNVYLPTSVEIDGETYPITGIAQPLDIEFWSWLGTTTINIPEGYTYICDNAFASVTKAVTFNLPSTLENIGSSAFMPARNITQTINYAGSRQEWNAIEKANDYENGQGNININYNR